jgi:hypothetical protein
LMLLTLFGIKNDDYCTIRLEAGYITRRPVAIFAPEVPWLIHVQFNYNVSFNLMPADP